MYISKSRKADSRSNMPQAARTESGSIPHACRRYYSSAKDSRLDGLGDGSDLVDLEQQSVTSRLLDGGLDPGGVGHGQVVTDDLDLRVLGEVRPGLPVVLVEGVLR